MADRLISEIDPAEFAKAVGSAMRDAGIFWAEDGEGDDGDPILILDGEVSIAALGSHLKRLLLLDPPPPAS